MIDIRQHPELLRVVNAILNNKGVAEIKVEEWKDGERLLVVEQKRSVRRAEHVNNGETIAI